MIVKLIKWGTMSMVALIVVGGLLFGGDILSYAGTSARSVRTAVKDAVPVEFQLQRAGDLLQQIVPELHANIRLIAQEEVEVAALKGDISKSTENIADQRRRLGKVRDLLGTGKPTYRLGGYDYSHRQLKSELSRCFEGLREADIVLSGKKRLLITREKSLQAAVQMLERTRSQKVRLADQIRGLEAQHRLLKAASVGSHMQMDGSKLAQTDKLIREIRKRLDVAERVLAHEAKFTRSIPIDTIDDKDLLDEVDEYLSSANAHAAVEYTAEVMQSKQN